MNENMIHNDEIEIDLLALMHALLRKWWLILITGVLGAGIMLAVTMFLITPMYESSAMLYILNKTTSVTSMADIQIGSALSSDFKVIATSKPVIDGVIEKIKEEDGMSLTRKEIEDALHVSNIEDTRLLLITVEHENPETACLIANAVADVTASQMAQIMNTDPPTMAERAEVAKNPVSPNLLVNVALGFIGGVLLICLLLLLAFLMDDNIKTEEEIEKYLGAPTLVMLPYVSERERKRSKAVKKKEAKNVNAK